ncbi:protein Wnt-10a-like isoform X2 [Zophobas morio]|uniref:protein Wnt-10a-like isoform X2 n=1 Tax=Zophobas morio TaxID=2755281 RepID=UPI003082FD77
MARGVPAVLVLSGLLSCAVLGKYSAHQKQPLMRADFHAETTLCQTTPGLRRPQVELCRRLPDVTGAALQGLQVAVKECQHQFRHHRWNCSSLATRAKNPYTSAIFQKGFRETAFAYAISTAGVVLSVAKACSQGSLKNCSCDTHKYKMKVAEDLNSAWKMGGCSHNLHYGIRFSKKFLDSRESGADIHSEINLHNNHVGRMVVAENMQKKCKCHGVSGACEFKTCWRAVPDIRVVGRALKEKFRQAVLVYQSNLVNRDLQKNKPNQKKRKQRTRLKQWTPYKPKRKRGLRNDLLFYETSPNFCDSDRTFDVPGTSGRYCNRTHTGEGSCSSLCCGRGYNMIKQRRTQACNCRFHWCCDVECENCTVEEWVTICK